MFRAINWNHGLVFVQSDGLHAFLFNWLWIELINWAAVPMADRHIHKNKSRHIFDTTNLRDFVYNRWYTFYPSLQWTEYEKLNAKIGYIFINKIVSNTKLYAIRHSFYAFLWISENKSIFRLIIDSELCHLILAIN